MSDMEWLAAVLSPLDIAPHPNFVSTEDFSPAAWLATAVCPASRYRYLVTPDRRPDGPGMELARAALEAFNRDSIATGAGATALLATDSEADLAMRSAAALISASSYTELDDLLQAIETLNSVLNDLEHPEGPDEQLLAAALLQQRSLRMFELGQQEGSEDSRHALDLLTSIEPGDVSTFQVSRGVAWNSTYTCQRIIELLTDAAERLLARTSQDRAERWIELARARRPDLLLLRVSDRMAGGFTQHLSDEFKDAIGFESLSPDPPGERGDTHLWEALLAVELAGHPSVAAHRAELGTLRFLHAREVQDAWLMGDAIRLLRTGGDEDRLKSALRIVRSDGPLEALIGDAQRVIDRRLEPVQLRGPELAVLSAAAELLDAESANTAYLRVLESVAVTVPRQGGGWEAPGVRAEKAWTAAVQLARTAQKSTDVAQQLLEFAKRSDSLDLDIALSRALNYVDFSVVSDATRAEWAAWADSAGEPMPMTKSTAMEQGELEGFTSPSAVLSDPPTVGEMTRVLNAHLVRGVPVPVDSVGQITEALSAGLERIRTNASEGRFEMGGVTQAEVAVGMAMYAPAPDLWPIVGDFLWDPNVQREDKTPALRRMVRERDRVPDKFIRSLAQKSPDSILSTSPYAWGRPVDPYPAALGFLATFNLLAPDRVMLEYARLAGSSLASARVEAARILTALSKEPAQRPWVITASTFLSFDSDAGVRAECGRALAASSRVGAMEQRLGEARVKALLAEDGIIVPLLVLRGIADSRAATPKSLIRQIQGLAHGHPHSGVRRLAATVLDQGS